MSEYNFSWISPLSAAFLWIIYTISHLDTSICTLLRGLELVIFVLGRIADIGLQNVIPVEFFYFLDKFLNIVVILNLHLY